MPALERVWYLKEGNFIFLVIMLIHHANEALNDRLSDIMYVQWGFVIGNNICAFTAEHIYVNSKRYSNFFLNLIISVRSYLAFMLIYYEWWQNLQVYLWAFIRFVIIYAFQKGENYCGPSAVVGRAEDGTTTYLSWSCGVDNSLFPLIRHLRGFPFYMKFDSNWGKAQLTC